MDELIDILDAHGNYTGKRLMKSEAHRKGLFHPTVHIWFYNKKGEILLQQRAASKETYPLLWDVSVAGHIGAGEDIVSSAIREISEEIGLNVLETDLFKVGVFKSVKNHRDDLTDCEFHHTYICELKVPLETLIKQESEVKALTLLPLSKYIEELQQNNSSKKYVSHDQLYFQTIIEAIENQS
ncbi:NUDIX domain-containing protein [Flavobacteriaceae bacterium KMM 6897]|nr:NUDIX domain-containing protein [Flavobacteriaceae bacterium KMM 6897]MEB8347529.1 NUDIX domain-containing protein [Flavobacteriaceae bacterium KMM 6898]